MILRNSRCGGFRRFWKLKGKILAKEMKRARNRNLRLSVSMYPPVCTCVLMCECVQMCVGLFCLAGLFLYFTGFFYLFSISTHVVLIAFFLFYKYFFYFSLAVDTQYYISFWYITVTRHLFSPFLPYFLTVASHSLLFGVIVPQTELHHFLFSVSVKIGSI